MAALYINEQLKDLTRCCICTEVFMDPRILSCIHTFCHRCLDQTAKQSDRKPGQKLPCPVCRREFVIPDDGISGIQKNFFMDNLIEMTKIANPLEKTYCGFCMEDFDELKEKVGGEAPLATDCCIDCHENLCDDCSKHHRKQKPTKNHQIVPLGSEVVPTQISPLKTCNQHSNEHLKIYCFECKTVVCVMCFVESHKSHKCTDIHKVADDFRLKIGQDAQRMSHLMSEGTTRVTKLEEVRTDVNRKVDVMDREIRDRARDLKALIDKHLLSQLEDLLRRKQNILKKLEVDLNETKQHLSIVESFQSYCTEVRSKGSPGDVCASANYLHTRADELHQLHQSSIRVPIAAFNLTYCKMDLENILDLRNNNVLGCIKDNTTAVNQKDFVVKAVDAGKKIHFGKPSINSPHRANVQWQASMSVWQSQKPVNYNPNIAFPNYWRHKYPRINDDTAFEKFQLDRGDQLYMELERMFACVSDNNNHTDDRGFFLRGLDDRSRKISKIWCIENAFLYGKYAEKKQGFCLNATVNTYRPLTGLLGSEVATLKPDMTLLNDTLDRQVNEYFLFHSATHDTHDYFSRMGFKSCNASLASYMAGSKGRAAANTAQENRLGSTCIRFRETVGFQDDNGGQNYDNIDSNWFRRRPVTNQSVRYVFVARVLLGNCYLQCKEPKSMKRGFYSHHTYAGSFDSVVELTKGGNGFHDADVECDIEYFEDEVYIDDRGTYIKKISVGSGGRDFLIHSPEQSYPDFLIEYQ